MEESSGDENKKGCVYFRKSVRIHARAINQRSHSFCEETIGEILGKEGLTYDVHQPSEGLQQSPKRSLVVVMLKGKRCIGGLQ